MNIVTLTLNPAFDVHLRIKNLQFYKENYADSVLKQAGGKGINISRALKSYHIESTAVIILGKEGSEEFLNDLKRNELSYIPFYADGRIRENITLHGEKGETRISLDGFTLDDSILNEVKNTVIKNTSENSIVTFTGRLPKGISKSKIIDFLYAIKNTGAKLIVDCNSFTKDELFKIKPFSIKPNRQEAATLFGLSDNDCFDANVLAEKLYLGGVENVILSLSDEGLLYFGKNGAIKVNVPKITPLSTIGAGDSLIAGFISGLVKGEDIKKSLKLAASFGTAACLSPGTTPPQKEEIEKIMRRI